MNGQFQILSPAIVVQAAAYATGNLAGGKLTITDARPVGVQALILRSAVLRSKVATSIAWDLFFFKADPAATTFTERAAIALAAADFDKIAGHITFAATDLKLAAASTNGAWVRQDLGLWMKPETSSLYAALVARGSITPALVSNLSLDLLVEYR
jgi:hypothetical protein